MTPTTVTLGAFAITGLAAAAVLAPTSTSWRAAAEHSRAFWLAWIVGFVGFGFAGPATAGLGWASMAWLAWWSAVAALQPSMVTDIVEVHRFAKRRPVAPTPGPSVLAMPVIRWQAPSARPPRRDRVPTGR